MHRIDLGESGFIGWMSLLAADSSPAIPAQAGVYAVAYDAGRPARWANKSCGGWHKGRDPTVTADVLESNWVDGSDIVYIGKTDQSLRTRIRAFARFGQGKAVAHWGGRLVWQLPQPERLMIGWRIHGRGAAHAEEQKLFRAFYDRYDVLPFANLRW